MRTEIAQASGKERSVTPNSATPEEQWESVVVVAKDAAGLSDWVKGNKSWIDTTLQSVGAILFRGFPIRTVDDFADVSSTLCGERLQYTYRSTPRTAVGSNIFTATEYPADSSIPLHNENAYQREWPMRLVFGCMTPAISGGDTPLASSVRVTKRISSEIREKFRQKRVMYIRYYGHGVDLPWQVTFQTHSKAAVERYCQDHDITFEWLKGDHLRTKQVCQALARHPIIGDEVWFNQAHIFHPSSLGPEREGALRDLFGSDELPRNACYGDGDPIESSVLDHIRLAYENETTVNPWKQGDTLLLDNMLVAHGRTSYRGDRKVLVAMGDLFSSQSIHS